MNRLNIALTLILALPSVTGCASSQPAAPSEAPKVAPRIVHDPLTFGPSHVGPIERELEVTQGAVEEVVSGETVSEQPAAGGGVTVRVFSGDELLYALEPDERGRVGRVQITSPMMSWEGVAVDMSYSKIRAILPSMSCKSGADAFARDFVCAPASATNLSLVFENGTGERFGELLTPEQRDDLLAGKSARVILWRPPE